MDKDKEALENVNPTGGGTELLFGNRGFFIFGKRVGLDPEIETRVFYFRGTVKKWHKGRKIKVNTESNINKIIRICGSKGVPGRANKYPGIS